MYAEPSAVCNRSHRNAKRLLRLFRKRCSAAPNPSKRSGGTRETAQRLWEGPFLGRFTASQRHRRHECGCFVRSPEPFRGRWRRRGSGQGGDASIVAVCHDVRTATGHQFFDAECQPAVANSGQRVPGCHPERRGLSGTGPAAHRSREESTGQYGRAPNRSASNRVPHVDVDGSWHAGS